MKRGAGGNRMGWGFLYPLYKPSDPHSRSQFSGTLDGQRKPGSSTHPTNSGRSSHFDEHARPSATSVGPESADSLEIAVISPSGPFDQGHKPFAADDRLAPTTCNALAPPAMMTEMPTFLKASGSHMRGKRRPWRAGPSGESNAHGNP
jgi:hypothetical protein